MRKLKYISPTSLNLFYSDPTEFYLKHLADHRPGRVAQPQPAAAGSAFDAFVKVFLEHDLHPTNGLEKRDGAILKLFNEQVDECNREWAWGVGDYLMASYIYSGAYSALLALLEDTKAVKFEGTVEATVNGVPFLGKPDCEFIHSSGRAVILDWKVNGFTSKHAKSPEKFFAMCNDGVGWPKPSRSSGKPHPKYVPVSLAPRLYVHDGYMEEVNTGWADQLAIYSWCLGHEVCDEVVAAIDQIVCKPTPLQEYPFVRVAQHRSRGVSCDYQTTLWQKAEAMWHAIQGGHPFMEMTKTENDDMCEQLEMTAQSLAGEEGFFAECGREWQAW